MGEGSSGGGTAPAMRSAPDAAPTMPVPATASPATTRYRGDIDGLRAISVLAVLAFHLSPRHAPAGAIGVDIFFVISGYLIGGLLLDQIGRGAFSYAHFYMRRIRRIMPALLVVIVAVLAGGLVTFFPAELTALAASALYALVGASNVYFYLHSDYFGDNSSAALLHSWSLGVEEQFYVLLPPLIALATRLLGARRVPGVVAIVLLGSLALSEASVRAHSTAAFYLIHSRAWELAIGVLFAGWRLPARLPPVVATALAALGLALIAASLVLLRPDRGFPGLAAVPPCLGAALLLASGAARPSIVHRMLAVRPLRLIGLASYSIYLWHWPVIIFSLHALVVGQLPPRAAALAAGASLLLGFLSWRFVEGPFRRRTMSARAVLGTCGALFALAAALAVVILARGGLPERIPPRARALAALEVTGPRFTVPADHCFVFAADRLARYDARRCLAADPGRPNWLLVGDSHAAMLYGALVKAFPAVHVMPAVAYGCEPQLAAADDAVVCNGLWHRIFTDYLSRRRVDGVILTSRWGFVDRPGIAALKARLDRIGVKLLLIGPTPDFSAPVSRILAEAERRHDPGLPSRVVQPRVWEVEAQLSALANEAGIAYASPLDAMCRTPADCLLTDARGLPLYTDQSHYDDAGALTMIRRLAARDGPAGGPLARTLGPAASAPVTAPVTVLHHGAPAGS